MLHCLGTHHTPFTCTLPPPALSSSFLSCATYLHTALPSHLLLLLLGESSHYIYYPVLPTTSASPLPPPCLSFLDLLLPTFLGGGGRACCSSLEHLGATPSYPGIITAREEVSIQNVGIFLLAAPPPPTYHPYTHLTLHGFCARLRRSCASMPLSGSHSWVAAGFWALPPCHSLSSIPLPHLPGAASLSFSASLFASLHTSPCATTILAHHYARHWPASRICLRCCLYFATLLSFCNAPPASFAATTTACHYRHSASARRMHGCYYHRGCLTWIASSVSHWVRDLLCHYAHTYHSAAPSDSHYGTVTTAAWQPAPPRSSLTVKRADGSCDRKEGTGAIRMADSTNCTLRASPTRHVANLTKGCLYLLPGLLHALPASGGFGVSRLARITLARRAWFNLASRSR